MFPLHLFFVLFPLLTCLVFVLPTLLAPLVLESGHSRGPNNGDALIHELRLELGLDHLGIEHVDLSSRRLLAQSGNANGPKGGLRVLLTLNP